LRLEGEKGLLETNIRRYGFESGIESTVIRVLGDSKYNEMVDELDIDGSIDGDEAETWMAMRLDELYKYIMEYVGLVGVMRSNIDLTYLLLENEEED
jgi:hypothetical protein